MRRLTFGLPICVCTGLVKRVRGVAFCAKISPQVRLPHCVITQASPR